MVLERDVPESQVSVGLVETPTDRSRLHISRGKLSAARTFGWFCQNYQKKEGASD